MFSRHRLHLIEETGILFWIFGMAVGSIIFPLGNSIDKGGIQNSIPVSLDERIPPPARMSRKHLLVFLWNKADKI
jgi:hypothetical protein